MLNTQWELGYYQYYFDKSRLGASGVHLTFLYAVTETRLSFMNVARLTPFHISKPTSRHGLKLVETNWNALTGWLSEKQEQYDRLGLSYNHAEYNKAYNVAIWEAAKHIGGSDGKLEIRDEDFALRGE